MHAEHLPVLTTIETFASKLMVRANPALNHRPQLGMGKCSTLLYS